MPTVNWTVNGTTLADQCGWSGDGAAHPFNGTDYYVDETYNTDSKASAARLTGAGFSGTIDSAILTIPRFSDNQGTNGTLRIRLIAENNPGSLAASGGTPPSARTYRTAYVDFNFPNDSNTVNIDVTTLIQDLLTAGFTYTGTQLIGVVIAGSSVGGTGWGSNATVSWRALWKTTAPLTLAITYTAGGSTATGTGTATGSSTVAGSGLSAARATVAASSSSAVTGYGLSSSRGTGVSTAVSSVVGIATTSGAAPSFVQSVAFSYPYNSAESASGTITSANITTTAGNDIFIWCGTWEYHNDNQPAQQARDQAAPTDNKSGTYNLIGTVSTPNRWPTAGEAWYRNTTGTRGSGHNFTKIFGYNSEITCFALEVSNAGAVSNFSIQQFAAGGSSNQTYTVNVTSNGPALLVVTLFVDQYEQTAGATPDGWTLVGRKGVLSPVKDNADIACVIFAKQVTTGGSYTCPIAINGSEAQGATSQSFAIESQGAITGGSSVVSASSVVGSGSSRASSSSSVSSQSTVVGVASSMCAANGATSSASTVSAAGYSRCLATGAVSCTSSVTGTGSSISVAVGPISIVSNTTGVGYSRYNVAPTIASAATVAGSGTSRSLATGTVSSLSTVVGSGESGAFALGYGPSVSVSTAVGSGSSSAVITGTATGSSSVTAPGTSSVLGVSSVSSASAAPGSGSSRVLANGSTSSASSVVGVGSGVASGTGIGTASSVSTVYGAGASRVLASAPLSVASITPGQGASRTLGSGSTASSSTAIGSGESAAVVAGTGQASSSSSVSGQAKAIIYAFGGSAGQVLAIAAGFSLVVASAPIYSASSCSAVGSSVCLASGSAFSSSTVIGSAGSRAQVGVIAMQISNACTMTMEFFP